jgi:DNA-binding HxlR family transcriptional regulator
VLRDIIIFAAARHYRQLLNGPERISSNILADRLATLVGHGLLTRSHDPSHKQKITHRLTEQAIELVPSSLTSNRPRRWVQCGAKTSRRHRRVFSGGLT